MDIHCPVCAEPLDIFELHSIADMTYTQARDAFYNGTTRDGKRVKGCAAIGMRCNTRPDGFKASASAALHDMMGDDLDGIAAMMEDADMAGMFD